MSFTEIAEQRRLRSPGTVFGELQWDVRSDGHLRIPAPPNVDGILQLMPRRGLQPELVTALLDQFPARPIERALIAWDVAHGALLGRNDDVLVQRIAAELAPLQAIGPTRAVAVHRDRVGALIDSVRPTGDVAALLNDYDALPSLAALVGVTAVRSNLDGNEAILEATLSHARRLALAHLPSLALAFLQILWDRFAAQKALDVLIELALDHRLLDAIPAMEGQDDVSVQRQAYVLLRAKLATYEVFDASVLAQALNDIPAVRDSSDPSLLVVRAELALMENKALSTTAREALETLGQPASGWRYAVRVRNGFEMQLDGERAASLVELFISTFGNDAWLWRRAALRPEGRTDVVALLSREVRYVSHDPEVWRGLAAFASDAKDLEREVDARLSAQSTHV